MDDKHMREKIEKVLANLAVEQLEQRLAPVKCEKNPEAPECAVIDLYGVDPGPVERYGIGF